MSTYTNPDENPIHSEPGQRHVDHGGETPAEEEETLVNEEADKGMEMGTGFEEDKEQDLDDLIHSQATLQKNTIPRPEDM